MNIKKCGLNINQRGEELYPHGNLEFPCAVYKEVYDLKKNHFVPWHWHDEMEIVYNHGGKIELQISGKSHFINEQEAYIINTNVPHYLVPSPLCELYSIVFHTNLVAGENSSIFFSKYIHPLISNPNFQSMRLKKSENENELNLFLDTFFQLTDGTDGYEFSVRNNLSRLCLWAWNQIVTQQDFNTVKSNVDTQRICQMLEYIHENFSGNIQLRDIANTVEISERECLRCFQRMIKTSPIQYILNYRVQMAAKLLTTSLSESISNIATAVGFDSSSNFTKTFKRFYKLTPSEYRKQECNSEYR